MLTKPALALLAATLIAQPALADTDVSASNTPCSIVVKSCLDAGYTDRDTEGKQFWSDCMKPLIMNKPVTGITIDAKDITACRMDKINQLEKETVELKAVK